MKRILQIFSVMLLSCLAVVLFGIATKPQAKASDCEWANSGQIKCQSTDYYFNPGITQANGGGRYAIFIGGSPKNKQLYIDLEQGDGTSVYYWSVPKGSDEIPVPASQSSDKKRELGNHSSSDQSAANEDCSLKRATNCNPKFASDSDRGDWENDFGKASTTDKWGNTVPFDQANLDRFYKQETKNQSTEAAGCGIENALSFFLCPVRDLVVTSIDNLTTYLQQQLAIYPVSGGDLQAAFNNFRNIANSLYIIIFLVIIFSNFFSTGLDNYSIKKMLPRLLAAVIATQFGFLICTLAVDLSNIIAIAIPSAIGNCGVTTASVTGSNCTTIASNVGAQFDSIVKTAQTAGTVPGAAAGAAQVTGYTVLVLGLLIVCVVIVIIALCYLVFRNVFLIVLIFISPLAFAAWVLPQTQQYAKKWATWFIKLLAMGPIIGLILGGTILIQKIFSSSSNTFLNLVAIFVPFIGLAIIPKSLKWSADVMTSTGKAIQGSAVGKTVGKGYDKGKDVAGKSAKEGKLAEYKGRSFTRAGKALGGKTGLRLQASGAVLKKAPSKAAAEKLGALSIEDQIKYSARNDSIGKAARGAMNEKRRTLLNTRNLDAQQMYDLERLNGKSAKQIEAEHKIYANDDGKVDDASASNNNSTIFPNPNYVDQGGGAPGGGSSTNVPALQQVMQTGAAAGATPEQRAAATQARQTLTSKYSSEYYSHKQSYEAGGAPPTRSERDTYNQLAHAYRNPGGTHEAYDPAKHGDYLANDQSGWTPPVACWVAREVYGVHNPQWLEFRYWMLNFSPSWFKYTYLRYGEGFAIWLKPHSTTKKMIKLFMDSRIKRLKNIVIQQV